MSTKAVLSEDEIDALMGSAGTSQTNGRQPKERPDVSRYDFSGRENKLFGQIPGLRELNEKVCSDFTNLTAEKLRLSLDVSLADIAIREGQSLKSGFSDQAIISMAKLEPLKGFSLVEVPIGLLTYITESYFGGSYKASEKTKGRSYSRSEVRVQNRLVSIFFSAVESGWATAISCRHEILSTETDIQHLKQPIDTGKWVCISFTLCQEDQKWQINWFFPYSSLEPLREKLGNSLKGNREMPRKDWSAAMSAALLDVPLRVSGVLLEREMGLGEVLQLKKGSIIPIRMPYNAQFRVEDQALMSAEYGANESQKAVKLVGRPDDRN